MSHTIEIEGIRLVPAKEYWTPVLICRICNKVIDQKKKEKEGMCFWNNEEGIFAHKKCMNAISGDTKWPHNMELEDYFFHLSKNLHLDRKKK